MENKKRTQTIAMIIIWGLVCLASCIYLVKLIVSGSHEFPRWLFFAASLLASVLFILDGFKRLKNL